MNCEYRVLLVHLVMTSSPHPILYAPFFCDELTSGSWLSKRWLLGVFFNLLHNETVYIMLILLLPKDISLMISPYGSRSPILGPFFSYAKGVCLGMCQVICLTKEASYLFNKRNWIANMIPYVIKVQSK